MLILFYNQRNKSVLLYIMSSNLQNWLDIHWSNPFSWLIIVISRDVVLKKRCGNAPKKRAFLKQLQTHFKAKHEKGMVTPFPRVPAPLHPWLYPTYT